MTEMCDEEWRPIPHWEGFYEASSLGSIRSVSRLVQFKNKRGTPVERWLSGRILKPARNDQGYLGVILSADGEASHREVHTLVCAAFHGERPAGMQAAHIDGNPSNCRKDNLRWATPSENAADKRNHGTLRHGETHYRTKLNVGDVVAIRSSGETLRALSARYGIGRQAISKIKNGQSWATVVAA